MGSKWSDHFKSYSNFYLVIPVQVNIDGFFRNDDQVWCNGSRRVQWQLLDTGYCSVQYTIQFRNSTNDTIDTVENIIGHFYCTSNHNNAISVIMWATYKGRKGIRSNETHLAPAPPTTPAATTLSPAKTKGIGIFMYVCR